VRAPILAVRVSKGRSSAGEFFFKDASSGPACRVAPLIRLNGITKRQRMTRTLNTDRIFAQLDSIFVDNSLICP
jgi:hypothetical protein